MSMKCQMVKPTVKSGNSPHTVPNQLGTNANARRTAAYNITFDPTHLRGSLALSPCSCRLSLMAELRIRAKPTALSQSITRQTVVAASMVLIYYCIGISDSALVLIVFHLGWLL